jgi:predicted flavoprotein YhiN
MRDVLVIGGGAAGMMAAIAAARAGASVTLLERNEKLKNDLQRICEGKLPTVEQIKSVYAASGILSSLNEKTDSDNLMALWATLKEWHKELSGETV